MHYSRVAAIQYHCCVVDWQCRAQALTLHQDAHQRFMISVDVTHIAMQVVPPLHTTKVHTHEFSVYYMVSTLSGGELLAVECHWTSTLRYLSTHSNNRSISGHIKWLTEVRQRQYWCCSQLLLQ